MKLSEMGKYIKIKHSISSLPKVWGTFFLKKLCMGEQAFLGKFIGAGGFHMGTNDQIMQGGEQVSHGGRHT